MGDDIVFSMFSVRFDFDALGYSICSSLESWYYGINMYANISCKEGYDDGEWGYLECFEVDKEYKAKFERRRNNNVSVKNTTICITILIY